MLPQSDPGASVLIVDADAALRCLIGAVLEHAGFCTVGADDLDSAAALLETSKFAVILRDLNLAPTECCRSLQQLRATALEVLQRTIVMTTTAARASTAVRIGAVFAIVEKPIDIGNLVDIVRACARGSRESDRREASEPETDASVEIDSLQRFAMSVPSLEHLLSVPVAGPREAALRAEMRRKLGELAGTLREAANVEASRTRAGVFRAASTTATRLARVPAAGSTLDARGRDH